MISPIFKRGALALALFFVGWGAGGAETTDAADYELAADKLVSVATGDTLVMSGTISGTGKLILTGGGTLALSNTGNTFSGGVTVTNGVVRADGAGTLGSGKITLVPKTATSLCQVYFAVAGTYANAIEQQGTATDDWNNQDDSCARILIYKTGTFVLNGNITSSGHIYIRPQPANTGNADGTGPKLTINGAISAPGKSVRIAYYGAPVLNGKITCAFLDSSAAWSGGATVTIANDANSIGKVRIRNGVLKQTNATALSGAGIWIYSAWDAAEHAVFDMNGFNATTAFLSTDGGSGIPQASKKVCAISSPSGTPTLTITGATSSATSRMDIRGTVKVVVDVDTAKFPNFVQTFNEREIATTGELEVKRGTLKLTNYAVMRSVPKITVGEGGTLTAHSTNVNCFAGADTVTVNGTFSTTRTDTFAEGWIDLTLGADASFVLPQGSTLKVYKLTANGESLAAGTYTGVYGISGGSVEVLGTRQVTGEYVITVGQGVTNTLDCVCSGTGAIRKQGKGVLRLTQANTFSGGFYLDEGRVLVENGDALGSGTVTIAASTSFVRQFEFKTSMTVPNNFVQIGCAPQGLGNATLFFCKDYTYTLNGNYTASDRINFQNEQKQGGGTYPAPGPVVIFNGAITAGTISGTLYDIELTRVYGDIKFNGKIACKELKANATDAWSAGGRVYLNNADNVIASVYNWGPYLILGADTALGGASLTFYTAGWTSSGTRLNLEGHNAALKFLATDLGTIRKYYEGCPQAVQGVNSASGSPVLTLTGGSGDSATTWGTVNDHVNLVMDCADNLDFIQIFDGRPSLTDGYLEVKKGSLVITGNATFPNVTSIVIRAGGTFTNAITTARSLKSVKRLVVEGAFYGATANAFTGENLELELGADADFRMPAGCALTVAKLVTNGVEVAGGTYTKAAGGPLANFEGTIVCQAPAEWTGGAGADNTGIAVDANWNGGSAPDLTSGISQLKFAQGGTMATLNQDVSINRLYFFDTSFAFVGSGTEAGFTLGEGGVLSDAIAEGVKTNRFTDLKLNLTADQVWNVPSGRRMAFTNCNFTANKKISVEGTGTMAFSGNTTFDGGLFLGWDSTLKDWAQLEISGHLGVSGEISTAEPTYNGEGVITYLQNGGTSSDAKHHGIRLNNATVDKPIYFAPALSVMGFEAAAGTTNIFNACVKVANPSWQTTTWPQYRPLSKAEMIFRGGLVATHSFRNFGPGTIRIERTPCTLSGYCGLNPDQGTTIVDVAGNSITNVIAGYNDDRTAKIILNVSDAVTNCNIFAGFGHGNSEPLKLNANELNTGSYTIDFANGTTQSCYRVAVGKRGVLTGAYPAMINVTQGASDTEIAAKCFVNGAVTGGVGFRMVGAGTLKFGAQAFASAGDLEVASGTVEFAAGGTWKNGRKVTLTGGTFKVGDGQVFGSGMEMTVAGDDWQLDIPEGETLYVSALRDGVTGRYYASGDYGNAASGAARQGLASHFIGKGLLHVRRGATTIILR